MYFLRSWVILVLLTGAIEGRTESTYRVPPEPIADILNRDWPADYRVGPGREFLLLLYRERLPGIEYVSEPILRLAGMRFNPRTNGRGPGRQGRILRLEAVRLSDGEVRQIEMPGPIDPDSLRWSPDGRRLCFSVTRGGGVELWIATVLSGKSHRLTDELLNSASGPCSWTPDSSSILCRLVPRDRAPAPVRSRVPLGPVMQETQEKRAQVRTFQDLLRNEDDIRAYEYYLKTQLAVIEIESGTVRSLSEPGLFDSIELSPNSRYLLVERIVPPYSFFVPQSYFAREVEVWDKEGRVVYRLASLPLAEDIPIRGVRTGPRLFRWQPGEEATLYWVEALDEGDPKREAVWRDRLMRLNEPFDGEPEELIRLTSRFQSADWGVGFLFLSEYDRDEQWTRTWYLEVEAEPFPKPRLAWERGLYDAYNDPGDLVKWKDAVGRQVVHREGDRVFLIGNGSSPQGDFPFLDRLELKTFQSHRLFQSSAGTYEKVLQVLDAQGQNLLTSLETRSKPLNYFVRSIDSGQTRALTQFVDPAPELSGIEKRLLTYWREDGIALSSVLYLPPDYREGERLPLVLWAYPREYNDPKAASQVRGSPHRFPGLTGASHLFFLTQGYAVLDGPSMPIVGASGNDTFVEQLVLNAKAAIDEVVRLGIADRERIGVGGHSYGAFMAANLLAHTDFFAAGIARSGAYNRSLTPFGFQNEKRTFWEATEVYFAMSPFMHADRINEPLLLIHGSADNNSGTFPMQSERLFHSLKGLGGTARLVILPHESHSYLARESILHALAEMVDWFNEHVKGR